MIFYNIIESIWTLPGVLCWLVIQTKMNEEKKTNEKKNNQQLFALEWSSQMYGRVYALALHMFVMCVYCVMYQMNSNIAMYLSIRLHFILCRP